MPRELRRLIVWLVGMVTGSLMCFIADITDVPWQEFMLNVTVLLPLYLFVCWIDDLGEHNKGEETCSDT